MSDQSPQSGGAVKRHNGRLLLVAGVVLVGFLLVVWRLLAMGVTALPHASRPTTPAMSKLKPPSPKLPEIFDRNGILLAGNMPAAALSANPKVLPDVDDTVDKLVQVLPELDTTRLLKALRSDRRFVWIHRELTPKQQAQVHQLGLPGLTFHTAPRRVYPQGRLASHIVGYVDIDGRGRAGIEAYIDRNKIHKPVYLSLDLAAQFVLHDALKKALKRYQAKAASALILDLTSGEILAAVSLPDFDPNKPGGVAASHRFNRLVRGVYELGSVFKVFTSALVLELGLMGEDETIDVATPLRTGGFVITDHGHGKAALNLEEIFVHSSNVGTARMALRAGPGLQKAFLQRFQLLDPIRTELGPVAKPLFPKYWREAEAVTISYGHGIAVAPLQFAAAAAPLFNGGRKITPTFLKRAETDVLATLSTTTQTRLVQPSVSAILRHLMRRNVEIGTGRRAAVRGVKVGGKTGTAEKLIGKRYAKDRLRTAFLSIFPSDDPRFLMLVTLDEPKTKDRRKDAPASANAAPLSGEIIARLAPIWGLLAPLPNQPAFDEQLVSTY